MVTCVMDWWSVFLIYRPLVSQSEMSILSQRYQSWIEYDLINT